MATVLIAEDNSVNRELVREVLELEGHQIIEATNGEEALARVAECAPDLVLLDIHMPKLDGIEVIRRLRQEPRFALLPVVALTAFAMRGDRERMLAEGFNGYVAKPIDVASLLKGIRPFLVKGAAHGT